MAAALAERLRRAAIRRFGYRHLGFSRVFLVPRSEKSFGLDGLDLKILGLIDSSPNYYVEAGANDGVKQSNTLALELFFGWTGLLIEPLEGPFSALQRNRNSRRNTLVRRACVADSASTPELTIAYSGLMSTPLGLDSDIETPLEHAESGARFLRDGETVSLQQVRTSSLTEILDEAGSPAVIGLLSLDVEGAELEVLRGIDHSRFHFNAIVVESRSVDRIIDYLKPWGYGLAAQLSHHDYLFTPAGKPSGPAESTPSGLL